MAQQVNYFRGAVETLTCTVTPAEAVRAGQLVNFKGGVAGAGDRVHGVAAHDLDTEDLSRGLRIVVIGQVDMAAGGRIARGDAVCAGENGTLVSGATAACGTALGDAAAGERVAVLLFPH